MSEFNFQKAWLELAKPAFDSLPRNIRELVAAVDVECKDFRQDKNTFDLPWPKEADYMKMENPPQDWLYTRFNSIDSDLLAPAAHVVWSLGHWAFGKHTLESFQLNGTYWKFSNLADQVLRKRLSLKRHNNSSGITFGVHDGFLRLCLSTNHMWRWNEIGLATTDTFTKARELVTQNNYLEIDEITNQMISKLKNNTIAHNFIVKIKNYYK